MDIRVSGHQVETGEALQGHVEKRLTSITDKLFSKALSSHATFGRGPHDGFTSDIVMHVMQGLVLKGSGEAQDAHIALDRAADKIEKQLRRYMRRLQDRHSQSAHALKEEEAAYTVFDGSTADKEDAATRRAGHRRRNERRYSRVDGFRRGHAYGFAQHACAAVQKHWHRTT